MSEEKEDPSSTNPASAAACAGEAKPPAVEYDDDERAAMDSLRERVADLRLAHPTLASEYLDHDSTLWRFVLGCKLNVDEAEALLRRNIQWRAIEGDRGVDACIQDCLHPEGPQSPEAQLAQRIFYGGIYGEYVQGGGPLAIERQGIFDMAGLSGDPAAFAAVERSVTAYGDALWRAVREKGGKARGCILVDVRLLRAHSERVTRTRGS